MQKSDSQNRRGSAFRRTDRAIEEALIRLLKTKNFEDITVQDILNETPVTRATFYSHYHDKYEIAERMKEECFAAQKDTFNRLHQNSQTKQVSVIVRDSRSRYKDLLDALLKIHAPGVNITQDIFDSFRDRYLSVSHSRFREAEASIYAGAILEYQKLLMSDPNFSPDIECFQEMITNVFFAAMYIKDEKKRARLRKEILSSSDQNDSHDTSTLLYF